METSICHKSDLSQTKNQFYQIKIFIKEFFKGQTGKWQRRHTGACGENRREHSKHKIYLNFPRKISSVETRHMRDTWTPQDTRRTTELTTCNNPLTPRGIWMAGNVCKKYINPRIWMKPPKVEYYMQNKTNIAVCTSNKLIFSLINQISTQQN